MNWIKCSDRLPAKDERIGFVFNGHGIMHDVYFDRDEKEWAREVCRWEEVVNVTHWMPMPDAPKDEE